jgi:hypothetical protein
MASTPHTRPNLSHQIPGADVSAIKEGDRITVLCEEFESAILVETTGLADTDGEIYVGGPELNARGKPYANSGRSLLLNGPASGTWDWWSRRKPSRPQQTGLHRLVRLEGDYAATSRIAKTLNAIATVTVAPDARTRADLWAHPTLELAVAPDGSWTLQCYILGRGGTPVLLASGHIDRLAGPVG